MLIAEVDMCVCMCPRKTNKTVVWMVSKPPDAVGRISFCVDLGLLAPCICHIDYNLRLSKDERRRRF